MRRVMGDDGRWWSLYGEREDVPQHLIDEERHRARVELALALRESGGSWAVTKTVRAVVPDKGEAMREAQVAAWAKEQDKRRADEWLTAPARQTEHALDDGTEAVA